MTHFIDPDVDGRTLCGRTTDNNEVWRNDLRADCEACQDVWAARGWQFPLPVLTEVTEQGSME